MDKYTEAYEREFARLLRVSYAITFGYARHALTSILIASGLKPQDEIILSPLTCRVIPLALLSLNLKPVYVDISADTLNLDPQQVKRAIGKATQGILFQHTYGHSVGVEAVAEIASQNQIPLFEDCAQCLPYSTKGQYPGSWGQAAIFSNNLLKPLPAGSGGVAITRDPELARKIRKIQRDLPLPGKWVDLRLCVELWLQEYALRPAWYWLFFNLYRKISPGYKVQSVQVEIANEITRKAYRASSYQMQEGKRWLYKINSYAVHRHLCCTEYTQALKGLKHLTLPAAGTSQPLYYFPVLVQNKEALLRRACTKRIELIAWPRRTPIYPIENERDLLAYGYKSGTCPVAEEVAAKLIGLPTHSRITAKDRNRIIALLWDEKPSCQTTSTGI